MRYTERAQRFIHQNKNRPFFLYLAHTMPHIPQYASPAFAGRSKGGLYGDAIEELDWSTGQILDILAVLDLTERTLVVFTSDNGAGPLAATPDRPGHRSLPRPELWGKRWPTPRWQGNHLRRGHARPASFPSPVRSQPARSSTPSRRRSTSSRSLPECAGAICARPTALILARDLTGLLHGTQAGRESPFIETSGSELQALPGRPLELFMRITAVSRAEPRSACGTSTLPG